VSVPPRGHDDDLVHAKFPHEPRNRSGTLGGDPRARVAENTCRGPSPGATHELGLGTARQKHDVRARRKPRGTFEARCADAVQPAAVAIRVSEDDDEPHDRGLILR
jgi:hypothetical protein